MHLFETAASQGTGITGRIRRAYPMWPRRRLLCVLRRVVNTRTRPRAHAHPDARRRPRPFYVGIFERLKGSTPKNTKKLRVNIVLNNTEGSNARYHQHVLMRLRSSRDGAERCACQWLRVPCGGVVKQGVVPWTWSLLYVPMK